MHPDRSSPTRRRPWSPHHSVRARFALTIGLTGLLFALATTLLVGPFLLRHIAIGRVAGAALLSIYAAYTVWLLA